MKHLFLVRHGENAIRNGDCLTGRGKEQIASIANQIKGVLNRLNPNAVYIGSAQAERTVESAEIVGKALGIEIPPIKLSALQADGGINSPTIDFLIDTVFEDAMILVGHGDLLSYGRKFCDTRKIAGNGFNAYGKGEAIRIDLENKMSYVMRPKHG